MFLSLSTTHRPATDLGYLLHKNPARVHSLDLGFGGATMFYPEAGEDRCTFALVLDVDPVALVRGRAGSSGGGLVEAYVNDRPYAASSLLSVAMARGIRDAINGRSRERPTLAETAIPLELRVTPLPVRGDKGLVEALFAPLGYAVAMTTHPLDPERPEWGEAPYVTLSLSHTLRLSECLRHLYVLMPVLDDRKHYYVGEDEIEKLLDNAGDWLPAHPLRDLIVSRYLKRRGHLVRGALARLAEMAGEDEAAFDPGSRDGREEALERPLSLHDRRLDRVAEVILGAGAKRVADLGCGEGRLIARLLQAPAVEEILGVEVSSVELGRADRRLADLPEAVRRRVRVVQGSLIYRDVRLRGFDAAALVEVIEHCEPDRLPHLERAVFGDAAPRLVVVTTPNQDYNARFETLPAGAFRHPDHRFEWGRDAFAAWAERVAADYGYAVRREGIGEPDPVLGAPSQMAVFTR